MKPKLFWIKGIKQEGGAKMPKRKKSILKRKSKKSLKDIVSFKLYGRPFSTTDASEAKEVEDYIKFKLNRGA